MLGVEHENGIKAKMNMRRISTVAVLVTFSVAISACVTHKGPDATNSQYVNVEKIALSGQRTALWRNFQANEDCSPGVVPSMKVTSQPAHGKIDIVVEAFDPKFPKSNIRFKCNSRKYTGPVAYYTSSDGYSGTDKVSLATQFKGMDSPNLTAIVVKVGK
ncbi:hypothetical protein [Phyllobacterium zundukense]|jgi:hypothetical protein|uniref:Uncharacterized protein n=1 Tax=Phyllobacterium zundukense TaxID=1867719 RepID=A0ACD4D789_9HYPH|nr:hypothetical protein [Phyllobacterium zundukense]UXN61807.1 hypothetical protein N8E88_17345 [Phyllobacterium zundukense]